MTKFFATVAGIVPVVTLVVMGCSDSPGPTELAFDDGVALEVAIDAVASATPSLAFWAYTGTRPDMDYASDPINLIFLGNADPLDIRAALMSLDGQRSPTFPPAFPFDCTWEDAMGAVQTAFAQEDGWTGNAVQLQCGSYASQRFHLRLFQVAGQTIGAAHWDFLIPDTPTHQAIGWEVPEQFVTFDIARVPGLLGAPPSSTPIINAEPTYRGLSNDGRATVLYLVGTVPRPTGVFEQELELSFGRVIPRPFCSQGPTDLVIADGPVTLNGRFQETAGGNYQAHFSVQGQLDLTPFDVFTGQPSGETYRAHIKEDHDGQIAAGNVQASRSLAQTELPQGGLGRAQLLENMRVGSAVPPLFKRNEKCK